MNKWTSGYVTDIDYTAGFYGDMAPAHLSFALLAQGCEAPNIERGFNYCELGCGQGLTTNLLAAAYPNGSFWANDFNPTHIAAARKLAAAAGSENVQFFDSSFAEFCDADLPEFDFICLHGVWTWISEENRRAVLRLIRSRLKVGGVVYVSYNALPGLGAAAAAAAPARRSRGEEHRADRSPHPAAVAFAERVRKARIALFRGQPGGYRRAWTASKKPRRTTSRMNTSSRDFAPAYHADVVRDFSEAKLTFAGSADIRNQVDALNFDPQQLELLDEIGDPVLRETIAISSSPNGSARTCSSGGW